MSNHLLHSFFVYSISGIKCNPRKSSGFGHGVLIIEIDI